MPVIRFFCHICDRPLVCLEPGKRGRCPRCQARVRAPLGLPVSYQDAFGRIICERDWDPGEAEEALMQFIRPGGGAEAVGDQPGLPTISASATDATLHRIEAKVDRVLALSHEDRQEWLSIAQAASLTGLSYSHVRRAVIAGELLASNIGSQAHAVYRVARQDLYEWMAKQKSGTVVVPPKAELKELLDRYFPD